jgi:hypothetical protein
MKQRHRLRLLAAALLCAAPLAVSAQAPPSAPRVSHVPIPTGIEPGLADQFLESRFRDAETAAQMERLLTNLAQHPERLPISKDDQDRLKQASQRAGGRPEKMLQDPEVRRIIEEAAGKQALPNLDPAEQKRLEEYARRLLPPSGAESPPGVPPPPTGKPLVPPPGKPVEPGKPSEAPRPLPPPGGRGSGAAPVMPPPPPTSPVQERFRDLAEALADKGLTESPAFRRMLANLDHVKGPEESDSRRWERRLQGVEERFAQAGQRLPKISWPKADFLPHGLPNRPDRAAVAAEDGFGDGAMGLVVVAVAAVLVAWALLRRQGFPLLDRAGGAARLGPWPVRPEAVHTRDDLVRAFEYLALLQLGPAARSRNHREIAARLGEDDAGRRTAAERLAGLYEQARYAPPTEALPDADLATARADLSLLAGVVAA